MLKLASNERKSQTRFFLPMGGLRGAAMKGIPPSPRPNLQLALGTASFKYALHGFALLKTM